MASGGAGGCAGAGGGTGAGAGVAEVRVVGVTSERRNATVVDSPNNWSVPAGTADTGGSCAPGNRRVSTCAVVCRIRWTGGGLSFGRLGSAGSVLGGSAGGVSRDAFGAVTRSIIA